jgi:hypothetical protein
MSFRTGHDAPEPRKPPKIKPGELPPNRVAVVDSKGNRVGHVGFKAGPSVAARFGVRNAKLKQIGGKPVWAGDDNASARRRQELQQAQRVKANKGSVTFKPTRPDKPVRPERGG